ncbi:MAG: hypothetical protein IH969_06370 [Candidatus Krumholzibacteriota bacterium]|nr:hypothetical protein [Candidatus Krumholzibacteriota bacterium]
MQHRILIILAITASLASTAEARTWYVAVDGSGDAPTLHAAMDSANAGDTILVGPGTYEIETCLDVPAGVSVISENGPHETRVVGVGPLPPTCGFNLQAGSDLQGFSIERCQFAIFAGPGSEIIGNITSGQWSLSANVDCIIHNNLFAAGTVDVRSIGIQFTHNIVLGPMICDPFQNLPTCNNLLDEICYPDLMLANFSLDPEFCGVPGSGNYFLQSSSPCAPGNDPFGGGCGLIGPLPVGCGAVPTEKTTWGAIKARYGVDDE